MWVWDQSAGTLSKNGRVIARGYSGADYGKNNPAAQNVQGIGPIPRGNWKITDCRNSPNTGPCTLVLEACNGTDTCGRSAFRIHGDSIANPGTASHGCIILPRPIREEIWASNDHDLQVIE